MKGTRQQTAVNNLRVGRRLSKQSRSSDVGLSNCLYSYCSFLSSLLLNHYWLALQQLLHSIFLIPVPNWQTVLVAYCPLTLRENKILLFFCAKLPGNAEIKYDTSENLKGKKCRMHRQHRIISNPYLQLYTWIRTSINSAKCQLVRSELKETTLYFNFYVC